MRMIRVRWPAYRCLARPLATLMLLSLLAVPSEAEAQGGRARVRGTVTDASGEPLEGVTITAINESFSPSTLTATTSDKGRWAMIGFGTTSAEWLFRFEFEGHITVELEHRVQAMGRNEDLDVRLEKTTLQVASVAGGTIEGAREEEAYWAGTDAFEAGDHATAVARWEEFLVANPEANAVLLRIAEAHNAAGNAAGELDALERLVGADPENITAMFLLARARVGQGEIEQALSLFNEVAERDPENASLYYNIAEIYFEQRAADEAVSFYERALAIDPQMAAAYKQMGFAHINGGNLEAAAQAFRRFLEIEPEDSTDAALVRDVLSAVEEQIQRP